MSAMKAQANQPASPAEPPGPSAEPKQAPLGSTLIHSAPPAGLRSAWCGLLGPKDAGSQVRLCGWVARRRDHGEHLKFVDLRDRTGVVQCVVDGAHDLRAEQAVAITGTLRLRPEGTVNRDLATGEVEVAQCRVEILGPADPVPFSLEDRAEVDEAVRLRHRYLDLRRPRLQANLILRHGVNSALRSAMAAQGFVEVETPLLWTPTPEGAREFAVPSRLQPGSFYVLPQSPQIAKQLLMVSGLDRYYQIARCMRDEDLRADRQFEFTQLDMEASFVGRDDVVGFVSHAVQAAVQSARGGMELGFPTLSWDEAMDRFGTDKPDLRIPWELVDLKKPLQTTAAKALQAPAVRGLLVPGGGSFPRARLEVLSDRAKSLGAAGLAWFKVASPGGAGPDLEGPLSKFLSDQERFEVAKLSGASGGDLLLMVAATRRVACEVLGQLRVELARAELKQVFTKDDLAFCWIVDFPLFDGIDEAGRPLSAHHPFTMPNPHDLDMLETDPLSVRSESYDLVCNGWELGSGSIRIHRADIQRRVFDVLGIPPKEAEARFGFLLEAFRYGAPPHGGFAFGVDRLVAILAGEDNIREVIAFPKTQSGADLMTGAPKPLSPARLTELGLQTRLSGKAPPMHSAGTAGSLWGGNMSGLDR